jgi:hypothetical protein
MCIEIFEMVQNANECYKEGLMGGEQALSFMSSSVANLASGSGVSCMQ